MELVNKLKNKYKILDVLTKIIFWMIVCFVLPFILNTILFLFNINSFSIIDQMFNMEINNAQKIRNRYCPNWCFFQKKLTKPTEINDFIQHINDPFSTNHHEEVIDIEPKIQENKETQTRNSANAQTQTNNKDKTKSISRLIKKRHSEFSYNISKHKNCSSFFY